MFNYTIVSTQCQYFSLIFYIIISAVMIKPPVLYSLCAELIRRFRSFFQAESHCSLRGRKARRYQMPEKIPRVLYSVYSISPFSQILSEVILKKGINIEFRAFFCQLYHE